MPKRTKVKDLNLDASHSIWIGKAYRKIAHYDKQPDHALVQVETIPWPLKMGLDDEVWAVDEAEVPPSTLTTPTWNELLDDLSATIKSLKKNQEPPNDSEGS